MRSDQSTLWFESDPWAELGALRLELERSGRGVVDLCMLNPDIPPPRLLLDKLLEASVKTDNHRYAVSRGIRRLREAFALKYRNEWGVSLNPGSDVCVCMGTKDALQQVLTIATRPGERIILSSPTYPAHLSVALRHGLTPIYLPIDSNEDEILSALERCFSTNSQVSAVLLNFPNNPTGRCVGREFWEHVITLGRRFGALIINDFVYGEMIHESGARAVSLLSCGADRCNLVETYSLSKAYSVPGWRVGAVAGDRSIIGAVSRLKSHLDYGLFLPVQIAACSALVVPGKDVVGPIRREYERRCRVMANGLSELGWQVSRPQAGASVWARLPGGGYSLSFARQLLRDEGVQVMPGSLFGELHGEWVRFAMVASEGEIREVLRKVQRIVPGAHPVNAVEAVNQS